MKVLLVCESSYKFESGGRVVRYLAKILKANQHQFKIVVLDHTRDDYTLDSFYQDTDVEFLPVKKNLKYRMANLYFRTKVIKAYRKIIQAYQPEVVHFASFDHNKPALFIKESKKVGAKVVLQPWTMQFYCAQGFGFRNGERCELCADGNYLHAITKKCVSLKGLPGQLERKVLHQSALDADTFLSSNSDLDIILNRYGVEDRKIARFPVPFDCAFTASEEVKESDYYIFFGQANAHKGLQVLLEVFKYLPNQKLKIYPLAHLPEETIQSQNIELINGISWNNGLKEAIINAKAVLMPSLWSTSTEYALCEALLLKKPVVIFNVGMHRDVFKNGFDAMVVEPDDIDGYVKAIQKLDQDSDFRKTIGLNGYETLIKLNDPDKVHGQLLTAYSN